MENNVLSDLLGDIQNSSKLSLTLKNINIEITERCNLACPHCYMSATGFGDSDLLSFNDIRALILDVKNTFSNKILIAITGGEPLVREDIFDILEFIKQEGFDISLATNGALLDRSKIERLSQYVLAVSISLDGTEASHNLMRGKDKYEETFAALQILSLSKIPNIAVKTVVSKNNVNELDMIWEKINKLSIHSWHLIPFEPPGRGSKNTELLLDTDEYELLCDYVDNLRKRSKKINILFEEQPEVLKAIKAIDWGKYKRCSAGISSFSILHDGSIVSCINCDRKDIVVYGNVKTDNIKNVWQKGFAENRASSYKYCTNHYYLNRIEEGENENKR